MLRDSLGLTDVGAKNFRRGVFFCTLANLVLMAPIGILFLLVSDFMDHLVAGAPLPALAPYLAEIEERRVGKECLRLCRSRWSPYH